MPASRNIIYSRGFPYGAPLAILRGGATKDPAVKEFIRSHGFRWDGDIYAYTTYLDRSDFHPVLKALRDEFGCNVQPKADMDTGYLIDIDTGQRPEKEEAA